MYTGSFLVQGLFFRTFLHMASAEFQVYSMIVTQPWKVGLGWHSYTSPILGAIGIFKAACILGEEFMEVRMFKEN